MGITSRISKNGFVKRTIEKYEMHGQLLKREFKYRTIAQMSVFILSVKEIFNEIKLNVHFGGGAMSYCYHDGRTILMACGN